MSVDILHGDCLKVLADLPEGSVNCCVTSPPYWNLRDYGVEAQIGMEKTPDEYVMKLTRALAEVWRVLRDDGTLWINLGDSYANDTKWGGTSGGKHAAGLHGTNFIGRHKTNTKLQSKNLVGIPWRVAFSLQAEGWYLRQDIIWHKPNPMPESVQDRCTKAHEYIFLLSKREKYHYDAEAIAEPVVSATKDIQRAHVIGRGEQEASSHYLGAPQRDKSGGFPVRDKQNPTRNKRSVWTVNTQPFPGAHFAVFPPALIRPCILAGCPQGGTVLDPFGGSGTVGEVAEEEGRNSILIELNADYVEMAKKRTAQMGLFSSRHDKEDA